MYYAGGVCAHTEERQVPSDPGAPPDVSLPLWSFRDDVVIEGTTDGDLVVLTRWGEVRLAAQAPAIAVPTAHPPRTSLDQCAPR